MARAEKINSLDAAADVLERFYPENIDRPDVYTLTYIQQLLDFLGNPQERLKVIHIAGTSGKTSTCYYVAALLHAAGKKVGHTASPHVYALNERVQIGLEPLPEGRFCAALAEFLELVEESAVPVTYFEVLTAFAFWEFARSGIEYAVVETGMGGMLDATNVVENPFKVAVITDIGLDHQQSLGATLGEIAAHKAGIIQFKNVVFCYRQAPEIMESITNRSRQKQADLYTYTAPRLPEELHSLPPFQQRNFYLARCVARYLAKRDGFGLTPMQQAAAAQVVIPGRMQTVRYRGRRIILDAAHNSQKLRALGEGLCQQYPRQPVVLLVAFIVTHPSRVEPATAEIASFAEHVIVTRPPAVHSFREFEDPQLVAAYCKTHGLYSVELEADLQKAFDLLVKRPEPVLVVTGSLYLLGALHHMLKELPA